MEEVNDLTVEESTYEHIPEGATLSIERDHTNQFTNRRVITVTPDCKIPNKIEGSPIDLYQMPEDSTWTEIHVGLSREHEEVTFEESI